MSVKTAYAIYGASGLGKEVMPLLREHINDKGYLCFIDDNITHLIKPHNYGYKVLLSGWGETILEHKIIAKENNIPIITSISKYLFS